MCIRDRCRCTCTPPNPAAAPAWAERTWRAPARRRGTTSSSSPTTSSTPTPACPTTCLLYTSGNDRSFTALFDKRFKYFCWDKLYRRALYDGLRYPVGRIYEDAYLLPAVISRAQKLLMLPDVLYYYRMRPMSITHTRDGRLNQWLEATSPLVELAKEKYPQYLDLAWGRYNICLLYTSLWLVCFLQKRQYLFISRRSGSFFLFFMVL